MKALGQQNSLPAFLWSEHLALAAQDHCRDHGPKGEIGHVGSDGSKPTDRVNRYGMWANQLAENLAYGKLASGPEYVLNMYIDDGVPERSHRKNMLNEKMSLAGVAYCQHKFYGGMLVTVYANGFSPN